MFGLKMPILALFGGAFVLKMGKMETLCNFIPLGMQLPGIDVK